MFDGPHITRSALLQVAALLAITACSAGGQEIDSSSDAGASGDSSGGGVGALTNNPPPESNPTLALLNKVRIARDDRGVAMVTAESDKSALYGLGWAHAHDRLAQITWAALALQGRLAEFLGNVDLQGPDTLDDRFENTVAHDVSMRRRGLWRLAQRVQAELDGGTLSLINAYCDGVNARIASMPNLPQALTDHGVPAPIWTPGHVVGVWLQAAQLYGGDGLGKAKVFNQIANGTFDLGPFPDDPSTGVIQEEDVPDDWIDDVEDFAESVGLDPDAGLVGGGTDDPAFSHAWAVRRPGGALLVGAPRVPVMMPSLLHEWALHGDTLHGRGWGFVGAPVLLAGFNKNTAWSVTSAGLHQADVFIFDRFGPDRIRVDGQIISIETSFELVRVANGPDRTVVYEETPAGPLVDDLLPGTGSQWRYSWLHPAFQYPELNPIQAGFAAMRAETVEDQRAAGHLLPWPSLNRVFADSTGDIGYALTAAVPVRSANNAIALETAGIAAQYGSPPFRLWQGLVPPHLLPQTVDPSEPVIFSANHRVAGSFYPIPLGGRALSLGDSTRSRRIRELAADLTSGGPGMEWWDHMARDSVDPNLRDLVGMTILGHAEGWPFASRTIEALPQLQAWLNNGASVRLTDPWIGLVGAIDRSFRDPDLSAVHGEGENGFSRLARRVEAWRSQGLDFEDWPQIELITHWLDTVISDAVDAVAGVGNPLDATALQAASQAYKAEHETLILEAHTGAEGIVALAPWADVTVGPMACPDKQTLWSQHLDSVSFFVDLRTPDEAIATVAPGTHEPGRPHPLSHVGDWLNGAARPIPLSQEAFPAVSEAFLILP